MELNKFLAEWHNDNPRILVHTSGSTGKPKPLMVEKRRMLNSARITCDFLGLKPGDTALLCMPLDYIAGKMMVVRSLQRDLRLTSVRPSSHPLADETLPSFTFAAMVPMQVYNTLKVPCERERLMRIRHLIIGGGAISDELAQMIKPLPNAVWSTYGMTETLSHIALPQRTRRQPLVYPLRRRRHKPQCRRMPCHRRPRGMCRTPCHQRHRPATHRRPHGQDALPHQGPQGQRGVQWWHQDPDRGGGGSLASASVFPLHDRQETR